MARKDDETRVLEAFKRATLNYSEASRAIGTLAEVVDLIEDVRHETIAKCREEMNGAMVRVSNGAMTPERLRRRLAHPAKPEWE